MKTDKIDPARSATMRAVKSRDTKPELDIRSFLHRKGYRYRLHDNDLPGRPDIVFPGRRKVVLVHGCFWHGHTCARGARVPKNNRDYWIAKVARNLERDTTNRERLKALGWNTFVVWECQINDPQLLDQLRPFLDS
jgi:DNA mismatch endonuclease (patch repair protein)